MPSLETPPNATPPTSPPRVRTNRYGDLEEHELIHLLDALDDERAKARFRESVYISIIIWLAIGWFVLYGPQVIFHQPRLINPADVLKQRDKELTYLDLPKDIGKQLPKKPSNVISDKDRTQQTTKPTLDKKTLTVAGDAEGGGTGGFCADSSASCSSACGPAAATAGPAATSRAAASAAASSATAGGCRGPASRANEAELRKPESVGRRCHPAGRAGGGPEPWPRRRLRSEYSGCARGDEYGRRCPVGHDGCGLQPVFAQDSAGDL